MSLPVTAEPLPNTYAFGKVVGRIVHMIADNAEDTDDKPQARAALGTVNFAPKEVRRDVVDADYTAIVLHANATATLSSSGRILDAEGRQGIWLATGVYTVTFNIQNAGGRSIAPFDIQVTTAHTNEAPLDLVKEQPYTPPAATVVQTVLVPAGGSTGQVLTRAADGGLAWTNQTGGTGEGGDGASAYQVAVANGYVGTEAAWLASLVGPQGPAGPTGPQGLVGPQGVAGPQGIQGVAGPQGSAGTQGATGPEGPAGATGPIGPQGVIGPQGPIGPAGAEGPIGPEGPSGADGTGVTILGSYPTEADLTAAQPTGAPGDAYLVAGDLYVWDEQATAWTNVGTIQGPQGPAGPQGIQGVKGDVGATGATGAQGEQGPIGPQGLAGPEGPQGIQGAIGATGPKGDTGATGPEGPTGLTGATGPQGLQGLQGIQGVKGDPGAQGPIGLTGPEGLQGLRGETGATGPKGDTGAIGPTGLTGATGPAGPQGIQGATGATGAQGPIGPDGPAGPKGDPGTTSWLGITDKPAIPDSPDDIGAQPAGSYATTQQFNDLAARTQVLVLAAGASVPAGTAAGTVILRMP